MSTKSLSDRKKSFLEDCASCGPTMSMGDAGYQSDAPAAGPMAGYDQPLGKKKRKVSDIAKSLRKEGYKPLNNKRQERMSDAATNADVKYRKTKFPGKSDEELRGSEYHSVFSDKGDEILNLRNKAANDPKGYAKDQRQTEIHNRRRGFEKRKGK